MHFSSFWREICRFDYEMKLLIELGSMEMNKSTKKYKWSHVSSVFPSAFRTGWGRVVIPAKGGAGDVITIQGGGRSG